MAASLIGGLLAAGWPAERLRVAVRTPDSAAAVRARFAVACGCDVAAAIAGADVIVLAVKPQQLATALRGIQPEAGTVCISVAAGVRATTLRRLLGAHPDIVRTMPNTPALVRRGVTGLYAEAATPARSRQRAEAIMRAVGSICWVDDEERFDALTALSGCGPAYFYYFTEAMREAATTLGLPAADAARLARETLIGAAALADAREDDIAELRRQVTSKGGATEAALAAFDTAQLPAHVAAAMRAAMQRSLERGLAAERELGGE